MVNAANLALISPYFGTTLSLMTFKIPSASLNDDNDDDDDVEVNHKEEEEDKESDNEMDANRKEKEDEEEDENQDDEYDDDYKMITYNDFDEENEKEDQLLNEEEDGERDKQDIETNQFIRIIPHIDDPSKPVIFDVIQWKKKQSSESKIVRLGRCPPTSINNDQPIDVLLLKSKVVSRYHCDIGYENGKVLFVLYKRKRYQIYSSLFIHKLFNFFLFRYTFVT